MFYFIGVEARGFMFGPPIALAIGAKFVPLRKPGKLPGMLCKIVFQVQKKTAFSFFFVSCLLIDLVIVAFEISIKLLL